MASISAILTSLTLASLIPLVWIAYLPTYLHPVVACSWQACGAYGPNKYSFHDANGWPGA